MRIMNSSIRLVSLTVAAALSLSMSACAPRVDARGNLPDPESVAQIKAGESTRNDVTALLGSPSTMSNFDGEAWYYISKRTETTAFFAPEVENQQILVVNFDILGKVAKLNTLGLKEGRIIDPVSRKTPTSGNEITLLQQLFGNLGRFNKSK